MTRVEELKGLDAKLEVVELEWDYDSSTGIAVVESELFCYTVLPDAEEAGKYRAYYDTGRYKQVDSLEEGKTWATQDHLKGKLLKLLKLKGVL